MGLRIHIKWIKMRIWVIICIKIVFEVISDTIFDHFGPVFGATLRDLSGHGGLSWIIVDYGG